MTTHPGQATSLPLLADNEREPSNTTVLVWVTLGDLIGTDYTVVMREKPTKAREIMPGHRAGDARTPG